MGLAFGCGGVLFVLFVVLLVGSALVRAAVSLANRVVGRTEPPDTFGQWDDWDSDDEPAYVKSRRRGRDGRAIPEPGIASGMLITLVSGLIHAGAGAVCAVLAEAVTDDRPGGEEIAAVVALALVALVVTFVVHAFLLVLLLPTTFGRAALVGFFHYLIVGVIALVVVGAIHLVLGP